MDISDVGTTAGPEEVIVTSAALPTLAPANVTSDGVVEDKGPDEDDVEPDEEKDGPIL